MKYASLRNGGWYVLRWRDFGKESRFILRAYYWDRPGWWFFPNAIEERTGTPAQLTCDAEGKLYWDDRDTGETVAAMEHYK